MTLFTFSRSRYSRPPSLDRAGLASKLEDHVLDDVCADPLCCYATDPEDEDAVDLDSNLDRYRHMDRDHHFSHDQLDHQAGSRTRASSSSCPSTAYSPPRPRRRRYSLPRGLNFLRLMNRTSRCLVIAIVLFFSLFILSLVRASQVDNWKLENGQFIRPPPPPPAWEQFTYLTRFYGGLYSLVPASSNRPEWPRTNVAVDPSLLDSTIPDDVPPETDPEFTTSRAAQHSGSKPFHQHPDSILAAQQYGLRECFLDFERTVRIPSIRYYDGKPAGFPDPAVGSYDALQLPADICFERFGRYGPYGFGYSIHAGGLGTGQHGDRNGSEQVWETEPPVDYGQVDWAEVQRRCYRANAKHFLSITPSTPPTRFGFYVQDDHPASQLEHQTTAVHTDPDVDVADDRHSSAPSKSANSTASAALHEEVAKRAVDVAPGNLTRTAVVIRAWDEFDWKPEDIANLRAIISELSLASRGRYDIHLLVQVKNDALHPVWADREAYQDRVNTVPAEFRGLVTLWTETQMLSLYQGIFDNFARGPDLPVHGSYRGLSMAMQYFGYNHPEYDFFWQWEMDGRYIGHYFDLFFKLEQWGREQPRKALWERNERFFIPAVHGSWDEFKHVAKVQADMASAVTSAGLDAGRERGRLFSSLPPADGSAPMEPGPLVWGPVRSSSEEDWFETENDPTPPTLDYQSDNYKWGVGEEADLIALYPIFDPEGTTWGLSTDITGYNGNEAAPPRRAHMVVSSRVSRRLLLTMHRETTYKKHFAFPEMWAATVAFHHGFKAVSAPQPIYTDRAWPAKYLAKTLNGGRSGASGGSRTSVFGDREHNLRGLSWFYDSPFPSRLYRRWMGLLAEDEDGGRGGEEFEMITDPTRADLLRATPGADPIATATLRLAALPGGEGRMCLPPMLLHPIKNIDLPIEEEEVEEPASEQTLDPTS